MVAAGGSLKPPPGRGISGGGADRPRDAGTVQPGMTSSQVGGGSLKPPSPGGAWSVQSLMLKERALRMDVW